MVAEVVPVWKRHVDASRQAVEDSVGSLLESFSQLCDSVMAVGRCTTDGRDEPLEPGRSAGVDLPAYDTVLTGLIAAVDVTHQRRERLLGQLATSLEHMEELEADLRALCLPNSDLATRLDRLDATRQSLAGLAQEVAQDTRDDHARQDAAVNLARCALVDLTREYARSAGVASEVHALSQHIEQDLERLLVSMQFQDRLNQMLDNVAADMARFTDWMARNEHASHADAVRWLAQLERSYTMDTQRAAHRGEPIDSGNASTIEFF
jgi:methyl-accepting chemotaxis protein